jgi:hypothetical protein
MIKWPRRWGASLCENDSPVASLAEIIIRLIDLRASIRPGEMTDASAVIRDALLLEADLAEWRATLPCNWGYDIRIAAETDCKFRGTFNGEYHLYNDHWIARMWDHYRWTRILVHELILTHSVMLLLPSAEICKRQEQSLAIISHLASNICASVWSQLNLPDPSIPGSAPQLTSVFMLLWHLRVAGSAVGVSESLYQWVLQLVDNIGQEMGIRQTKMVIFRTRYQRQHWKSTLTLSFSDSM